MFTYSKDGITISTFFDDRRKLKKGVYYIKIRVTYKGERKYYSTGKKLTEDAWEKLPANKSRAAMELKADIENSFNIVRQHVVTLTYSGKFSFEELNLLLSKGNAATINMAFQEKINYLKTNERYGNSFIYQTVLQGIQRFAGTKIQYRHITSTWLRKYEAFLLAENKTYNTVGIHMRTIRCMYNEAVKARIITESSYPFGRGAYEIKKGSARKLALTSAQIGRIAGYDDGHRATSQYRDYWIFIFLCNGINMADFVKLKYSDIVNNELYYIRRKTEHTSNTRREICCPVTKSMKAIIDRWGNEPKPDNYIFPILDGSEDAYKMKMKTQYATRAVNKHMAIIAEALGIEKISTYTARHSFATVLKRSGANIAYISESLGHSNISTTETYLASFESHERLKHSNILESVLAAR